MAPKRKRTSTDTGSKPKKPKTGAKPKPGSSKGGKPKSQVDKNKGASEPDPIENPVTWKSSPTKWKENLPDNHGRCIFRRVMYFLRSVVLWLRRVSHAGVNSAGHKVLYVYRCKF